MTVRLFIPKAYVKEVTYINNSTDEAMVENAIVVAQETLLKPYLNKCLYDKLVALIAADEVSDVGNEKYKTLLEDYIPKVLAWFTCVELYPHLNVKIDNSTFNKHSKENATPASKQEVDHLTQKARMTAETYANQMLDWLYDSDNRIDEFFNCTECQSRKKSVPAIEY